MTGSGVMGTIPSRPPQVDLEQKRAMVQLRAKPIEDTLVTKLGTVYHNFRIERVDPTGVTISYALDSGGLDMEIVLFNLLPDDWQRRYGYNPKKAAAFDLEQKQAMAQLREQMIADEQAYREKRAKAEAAGKPPPRRPKLMPKLLKRPRRRLRHKPPIHRQ